ncbi:hypothetical protein ACE1SV_64870 [Streptomyces sp. E-15]
MCRYARTPLEECVGAETSRAQDTDPPAPRAQLAAERLPTDPATTGQTPRPSGRRALGAGPARP